jgi:pimeloyl-ACP methyl ester carboxylesterase
LRYEGVSPAGRHGLHALDWGRRSARRVLVCAHGYSGNAHDFDFLARELARDTRVICPDVAGRGASDRLPSPFAYHFTQFLADFRALLAHIDADQVDWVGTSMGGLLGLLLAAEPKSPIRSLVMNDVGAFLPTDALMRIARNLRAPARFATLAEVEAHLRHTHRDWGEIDDVQWAHLVRHGARRVEGGWQLHYDPQIAQVFGPLPLVSGLHFWSAWHRARCPVLLVRGERSEVFPRWVAATMLDVKPQAELVEVAGAGHAPALMSRDEIAMVAEFVAGARTVRTRAIGQGRDAAAA